jgi:hypothetical protein
MRAIMASSLLPLLLVLLVIAIWYDAMRARERARAFSRDLCADAGVQLLDQTVALRRLRLRRMPGQGLALWRCYGFELSTNGSDRLRGSLDLIGGELAAYDLPLEPPPPAPLPASATNVIELRPSRRH